MYKQTYMTGAYANMSSAIAVSCNIHGHILYSSLMAARSNESKRINVNIHAPFPRAYLILQLTSSVENVSLNIFFS